MPGIACDDLKKLAKLRLKEAEALYAAQCFDGCVYLAGYAIEMALKARICKLLRLREYPPNIKSKQAFISHNLYDLKLLAGLDREIDLIKNKNLYDNWSKLVAWDSELRYEPPGKYSRSAAKEILDSIGQSPDGVLTWLTKRW
jgi:hypothetical protein